MTTRLIAGRGRLLGDDVNTDYIISSRRKRESIDAHVLKHFLLEGVDPGFAATVVAGDILVAGRNFGCGSAMEVAVTVIMAAGIPAVLARSFSRTFYRNAVNNGLIPVVADPSGIQEGALLQVSASERGVSVRTVDGMVAASEPLTGIALAILAEGGLVAYMRRHGALRS